MRQVILELMVGKDRRNEGVPHRRAFLGSLFFLVLLWNTRRLSLAGLRYYSSREEGSRTTGGCCQADEKPS